MFSLAMSILFVALAVVAPAVVRRATRSPEPPAALPLLASGVCLVVACAFLLATSIVRIDADKVGIVRKLYGFKSLPQGHLIATEGENGYQADIIPPGTFKVSPFFNVINVVTPVDIVRVPQGFYGRVVTQDGAPLGAGEVMAPAWPEADAARFLDAEHFLKSGGKRGLQARVLLPGSYPINLALFNVRIGYEKNGRDVTATNDDVYDGRGLRQENSPLATSITRVPAGFVGVVRSTITEVGADCHETVSATAGEGLVASLVPRGCKGIWNEGLAPGDYYMNRDAYEVTLVDTRVQTLDFRGGYKRRYIDLKVDQKGDFQQFERTEDRPFEADQSVDRAVFTKVEGWEVPQELRAVIQIQPEHAPIVVAAVGGLSEIERRIMVPAIRSHVRNVFGGTIAVPAESGGGTEVRQTRILDLVEQRPTLEAAILRLVAGDGARAGVDVKEIRLGDSVIPPELLLARQREQLAEQLRRAYDQERISQEQRQSAEQARATADLQGDLVREQIAVQQAELAVKRRTAEGAAERAYLEAQAAGQAAQTAVLGKDSVIRLQQVRLVLDLLDKHPDMLGMVRLPNTVVFGGGGLEGAAATLGGTLGGFNAPASVGQATPAAQH